MRGILTRVRQEISGRAPSWRGHRLKVTPAASSASLSQCGGRDAGRAALTFARLPATRPLPL